MSVLSMDRVRLPAELRIETTFLNGPEKFAYFLGCCRKERKNWRHRHGRKVPPMPARLFIGFDYFGLRGPKQIEVAFSAIHERFRWTDPVPGWIYILLIDGDGNCVWREDPNDYIRELLARRERALASPDRIVARVTSVNGSGFLAQVGDSKRGVHFAFYDSLCNKGKPRPSIGDMVTCLPTGSVYRGMRIVNAVLIDGRK
jgi:hypothetical protein